MDQVMPVERILFPIDFSPFSQASFKSLPNQFNMNCTDCILLHTFRLVNTGQSSPLDYKRQKEEETLEFFRRFKEEHKSEHVNYQLINEVGFLSARILHNLNSRRISLLILSSDVQKKLMPPNDIGIEKLMEKVKCPTLLLTD